MTDDRLLGLLTEILDDEPSTAPDRLLRSVLDGVRSTSQRPGWHSIRAFWPSPSGSTARRLAIGAAAVLVVVVASMQLLPPSEHSGGPTPPPTGSPSPTATVAPSVSPAPTAAIPSSPPGSGLPMAVLEGSGLGLQSGTIYTSKYFEPAVTFQVHDAGAGLVESEWCPPIDTSAHVITFSHIHACVWQVQFINPVKVDCGTADLQPDAEALATAILANPGMSAATDLGPIEASKNLPKDMFAEPYRGRVIRIVAGRTFDGTATNPDHCRFMPDDLSDDPTIEIRGDVTSMLVLIDVDGQLVVVRASVGGYDAPTGTDARERGYALAGPDAFDHLLSVNYDIRFGS
jgi:hypothetical protein